MDKKEAKNIISVRNWHFKDAKILIEVLNNINTKSTLDGFDPVYSVVEARSLIKQMQNCAFAVCYDDIPVGIISFSHCGLQNTNACEVSWVLREEYRGHGIMGEAAEKAIDLYMNECDFIKNIYCRILSDNVASIKTAEKAGMELVGVLGNFAHGNDCLIYQKHK